MILHSAYDDKKRIITFDDELFEVDQFLAGPEVLDKYGYTIPPAGWWSWGSKTSNEKTIQDNKTNQKLSIDDIQWLIGRPALHQHFGDAKTYPADAKTLIAAWRKGKVATIQKYTFPDFDCEDFAFYGMGVWHSTIECGRVATFIIWVTYLKGGTQYAHALNAFCTQTKFFLIDPQDRTYTPFILPEHYKIQVSIG